MKKIGILTFVKVGNYGAELQAYALEKVLNSIGYDAEIIDFSIKKADFNGFENSYTGRTFKQKINSLIYHFFESIMSLVFRYRFSNKKTKFNNFYSQIRFSNKEVLSAQQLANIFLDYSTIVVGSDQVWNFNYSFSPDLFLLSSANDNIRKISYAASLGNTVIPDFYVELYKNQLSKFTAISVREKSFKKILAGIGVSSEIVLDPTLLLSKKQWMEAFQIKERTSFQYLLIYELLHSDIILDLARKISSKYHYRIIYLSTSICKINKDKDIIYVCDAGPKEFVSLFINASFVLTTSFHGTAFSLNFGKPFYSLIGSNRNGNGRIIDLLEGIGLSNRIVYDNNLPLETDWMFDFSEFGKKLDELVDNSILFIKKSLH